MTMQPLPGLTPQDLRRLQEVLDYLELGVSANTRARYASAWRKFEAWTADRGVPALPASPELVAAYLVYLADQGMAMATIGLHRTALGAIHRSTGHQAPTDNQLVRHILAGLHRANGRAQRQASL